MRRESILVLLCLAAGGCGYVTHGSTQKIFIDTMPSQQSIEVDGKPYTTPVDLELARGTHHTVTTKSKTGAPLAAHITSETQWRYQVFDFFVLPIIGNIIDGVSGGDSVLTPKELVIPLQK